MNDSWSVLESCSNTRQKGSYSVPSFVKLRYVGGTSTTEKRVWVISDTPALGIVVVSLHAGSGKIRSASGDLGSALL